MSPKSSIFKNFIELFYPNLCLACEEKTPAPKDVICITCQYELPQTQFHLERENPFTKHFWGRIPINAGTAMYHFSKGSRVQNLIHKLKYEGKAQVGIKLGQAYGQQLKDSPYYNNIDLIVPVPLHPHREKQRGYNQSALFAKGLSETMEIPWKGNVLRRVSSTATQTSKGRIERFENVLPAFQLNHPKAIEGKHILLVDDVITTGATLEACSIRLLEGTETKVSLATIAFASN